MRRAARQELATRALVLVVAAAAIVVPAGCGEAGGGEAAGEDQLATAPADEGVITEPPAETAPEKGLAAPVRDEREGSDVDEPEEAAIAEACPDVVITPNSGGGLFDVEAEQMTCTDATTILRAWGEAGFPGDGPEGFACEELAENPDGSTRLRCTQASSGGALEFATGS
jgi:hypothetical protein